MESGTSWSGHERNVAWLNTGDGQFKDVSAVTGLDHIEDGRVALRCDWDRDGDVDLWLRSRNGPTLRYMENQSNPERFFEFDPRGVSGSVGLRIDDGARMPVLVARSSDGYLASPPTRMVMALTGDDTVQVISVTPTAHGGSHVISGVRERPKDLTAVAEGALPAVSLPTRVVLRTALPLPTARLGAIGVAPGAPHLVVVSDPECQACESILPGALAALAELKDIEAVTLEIGNLDETPSVRAVFAVAADLLGPGAELATPLSLLIDASGHIQVLYTGGLDVDTVTQDTQWFCLQPVQGAFRSTTGTPGRAGRWFHGMPRGYTTLIEELGRVGLESDAAFYAGRRR